MWLCGLLERLASHVCQKVRNGNAKRPKRVGHTLKWLIKNGAPEVLSDWTSAVGVIVSFEFDSGAGSTEGRRDGSLEGVAVGAVGAKDGGRVGEKVTSGTFRSGQRPVWSFRGGKLNIVLSVCTRDVGTDSLPSAPNTGQESGTTVQLQPGPRRFDRTGNSRTSSVRSSGSSTPRRSMAKASVPGAAAPVCVGDRYESVRNNNPNGDSLVGVENVPVTVIFDNVCPPRIS